MGIYSQNLEAIAQRGQGRQLRSAAVNPDRPDARVPCRDHPVLAVEIRKAVAYFTRQRTISDNILREKRDADCFARRSHAMNASTSTSRLSVFLALAAFGLVGIGRAAAAQPAPDTENGRYTFSPAADGMIRLDTKTGTVSNCNNSGAGWACYAVPDERKALDEEIGRLEAENQKLKAELGARAPAASDKPAVEGQRKIEIPLPSDQDMDRVVSFLQRAWKRLVDMATQMQKDVSGDGKI